MAKVIPSPWQNIEESVRAAASAAAGAIVPGLKSTPDSTLGDLAIPCFTLAAGGANPIQAAADLAAKLEGTKMAGMAKVVAAGPYVNVFLDRAAVAESTRQATSVPVFGCSGVLAPSFIVLEFSSPNTNKPQHLGHIRNNFIGQTCANLLAACGAKVIKTSVVNDRGIHICKSMLAYQRWGNGQTPEQAGMKGDHFVGQWYVRFAQELEQNPALQDEAQELLQRWEAGDAEVKALWERMNSWVYAGYEKTYADFGIAFDKVYYESKGSEAGKQKILDAVASGTLQRTEDGAVIAKLEAQNLPDKIVLRADGTSLYSTNDISLAYQRLTDYPDATDLAYVVGSEQNLYFRQLFAILKLLGFPAADRLHHVSYGMVALPEGRMKSREGTVVDADDLLADVTQLAADGLKERLGAEQQTLPPDELERRARIIALAAIRVLFLKSGRTSNTTFNPKEAVELTGRTGVNLLYTYARATSVLAKAGDWKPVPYTSEVSDSEWAVIKLLAQYPDAVAHAASEYEPSVLVNHLLDLAAAFNTLYHDQIILKADEPLRSARLGLVAAFQKTMTNGLKLLDIEPLAEM